MSLSLFLIEKPLDPMETFRLAEVTDITYRRMRNRGYARRHVDAVLPDHFTALEAAAAKIIKSVPVGEHPVHFINNRNLAVLKPVTMSVKRALCLGTEGRVYPALRGVIHEDNKFQPTALHLTDNYILVQAKRDGRKVKRIAILRPRQENMH